MPELRLDIINPDIYFELDKKGKSKDPGRVRRSSKRVRVTDVYQIQGMGGRGQFHFNISHVRMLELRWPCLP